MSEQSAIAPIGEATGTFIEARAGLGPRMIDAWRDMRTSTRRLIDEAPSEHRLLFFVLLSDMVFFLSWSLKTVVAPVSGVKDYVPLEIGVWLIGALMFRTAAMYLFSAVVTIVSRMLGGTGGWKATRCGLFWGALVAAPFGLLMAVVTVLISWAEPSHAVLSQSWVALPPYVVGLIPFVWFISLGVAEAQNFRANRPTIIAMSVATAALIGAGFGLRVVGIL